MPLVCLDTQILIWGIQKNSRETQKDMISKAEAFLDNCQKNKTLMMIPSIVLGEFLTTVDIKEHSDIIRQLSSSYIINSYDAKSAAIFAKLWREKKESGLIDNIKKDDFEIKRQELKADCMIVAAAIASKATAIYSYDKGLKSFAGNSINVLHLPELSYQEEIFK